MRSKHSVIMSLGALSAGMMPHHGYSGTPNRGLDPERAKFYESTLARVVEVKAESRDRQAAKEARRAARMERGKK